MGTTRLNAEQWIWCVFFGLGVLLWQQVVTTVPTSIFGSRMEVGTNPREPLNSPNLDGEPLSSYAENHRHSSHRDSHNPIQSRSGQILWIRGLTRLQTQIRVVNAFRHGVDSTQLQQAASNQNIQRVLQRQASLGKRSSIISQTAAPTVTSVQKTPEPTNNTNSGAKLTTTVTNGNNSTGKLSSSHTETA